MSEFPTYPIKIVTPNEVINHNLQNNGKILYDVIACVNDLIKETFIPHKNMSFFSIETFQNDLCFKYNISYSESEKNLKNWIQYIKLKYNENGWEVQYTTTSDFTSKLFFTIKN